MFDTLMNILGKNKLKNDCHLLNVSYFKILCFELEIYITKKKVEGAVQRLNFLG